MGKVKCPYCQEEQKVSNIIDCGHLSLSKMSKKGNTRNIYLCPFCNEVFEAFQKQERLVMPVDLYFKRRFQYCRGNLEKGTG